MKIPMKFVSPLTAEQINQLTEILKPGDNPRPRLRAQALLWSAKAVSIADIAQRCAVDRDTVSAWIDQWEQAGPAGLIDKPRSGNPGRLNIAEQSLVLELAKEHPRSIVSIRAALLDLPRVVLLDNASVHTSHLFLNRLPLWEAQGVFIKYLPAYSSSLNLIEILWRFIKYSWLPFEVYLSFDNLVWEVENILAQLGETFRINLVWLPENT